MFSPTQQTHTLLFGVVIVIFVPILFHILGTPRQPRNLQEQDSQNREIEPRPDDQTSLEAKPDAEPHTRQDSSARPISILNPEPEHLDNRVAPQIALRSREQSRIFLQNDHPRSAVQTLEDGLHKLRSVFTWQGKYSQIALLIDREKFEDAKEKAREVLRDDSKPSTSSNSRTPRQRPAISSSDSFAAFDKDQPSSEQRFDLAIVAEDWKTAEAEAEDLVAQNPQFFDEKPFARRVKLGMLQEGMALALHSERPEVSNWLMEAALQTFTIGCDRTEPLRRMREPTALADQELTIFDSFNVCANLFMSAARICVYFHEKGSTYTKKPNEMKFETPLTGRDWAHQALHFLESGRSRVLLDSMKSIPWPGPLDSVTSTTPTTPALVDDLDSDLDAPHESRTTLQTSNKDEAFKNIILEANGGLLAPNAESFVSDEWNVCSSVREILCSSEQMFGEPHDDHEPDTVSRMFPSMQNFGSSEGKSQVPRIILDYPPPAKTFSGMSADVPKDTAIVVYGLASQRPHGLIVIVITTNQIELVSWTRWDETSLDQLHQDVGNLQNLMGCKDNKCGPIGVIEDLCVSLSKTLLFPIASLLEPKRNLVVVPYGRLCHVPWPMLTLSTPETEHLITSTVPSFSIWDDLHNRARPLEDNRTTRQDMAIVTNSEYNEQTRDRNPLENARLEAVYLAWLNDTWPIRGSQSKSESFAEFKAQTSNTKIVHVAAHGTFDKGHPMESTVDLWGGIRIVDFTKDLTVRADLVVFSTCLSGFSEVYESGLSFSFAHTLLSTGTTAFVGALWTVEDGATLLLMMEFYDAIREGLPPDGAICRAQRSMRSMDQTRLDALVAKLEEMVACRENEPDELRKFIFRPDKRIRDIKKLGPQHFQRHRCWGAFQLVGYGHNPILSPRVAMVD